MSERPAVVVTYPGFDTGDPRTAGVLRDHGLDVRFAPRTGERSAADVVRLMDGAVGGIVSTDPFDGSVFAGCPALRVLARVGVGLDTVDVEAATGAGVAVTVTPGVNTATVADHTLALILACCRRLVENDRRTRDGGWDRGGALNGGDLTGETVGIVGLGSIGRAVARRLAGFDATLLGTDLPGVECDLVERVELDELLQRSAIVTIHVPLTAATRGLIGARELALMPDGAILVNTSRGSVIDEAALVDELRSGRLGAGLDVFEAEPPRGSPVLALERAVVTPHIAGISVRTQQAMLEVAVRNVVDVLAGREPPGLVNPLALHGAGERVA
jgi:phosphoglycerate dehydrogenase-like enzyme